MLIAEMNVDEKGELKRRIAIAICQLDAAPGAKTAPSGTDRWSGSAVGCGLAMWRTSAVLGGLNVLHAPSDREASTSGIQVLRVQQPQGRGVPRKLLALCETIKGILCKMTAPSFCFHPPFTPLYFTLFGRVANKRSLES
jgi:hypothetical protein